MAYDSAGFIRETQTYITNSAQHASDVHKKLDIEFEFFKGIKTDLTPAMCEDVYKELVRTLLDNSVPIGSKYGLMAAVLPVKQLEDGKILFSLQLGVIFPDAPSSAGK